MTKAEYQEYLKQRAKELNWIPEYAEPSPKVPYNDEELQKQYGMKDQIRQQARNANQSQVPSPPESLGEPLIERNMGSQSQPPPDGQQVLDVPGQPVLGEEAPDEDTEHAFNLGGWLKEMGSSVLSSVDSGLSGLGGWMQKNPALVASIASGLGRYAWDPDVGRGPRGGWSNKRALWNAMGTGVNARLGIEKQRLAEIAKQRGQLHYKNGGFYNIRPTDVGGKPSYSVNELYRAPTKGTSVATGKVEYKPIGDGMQQGQMFNQYGKNQWSPWGEPKPLYEPKKSTDKTIATGKVEYQSIGGGKEQGYMFNRFGNNKYTKWGEPRNRTGAGGTTGPLSSPGKIYQDMNTAKLANDTEQVEFLKNHMLKKLSSSKDVFQAEQSLRKEYVAGSAEYVKTRDAYSRIMAVGQDPSGFGDLALIFNYMKMLDPNSVVRESEFATASNTGSLTQRFIAMFNRMKLGMRLEANQRQELMEATMGLWGTKSMNHSNLLKEHMALANSTQKGLFPNLDPERTYIKYNAPTPQELKEVAANYRARLSGPNIGISREAYLGQPYVKTLTTQVGPADRNQGKNMEVQEGIHKGIYVSELNPVDNQWYWVQHQ